MSYSALTNFAVLCSVVFHYALVFIPLWPVLFSHVCGVFRCVLLFSAWIGFVAVSTLFCRDVFCCVLVCRDVFCWVLLCRIFELCFVLLYSVLICSVLLCSAVLCFHRLLSTLSCSALVYSVLLCSTLLCLLLYSALLLL
jgi:hypothetical protein